MDNVEFDGGESTTATENGDISNAGTFSKWPSNREGLSVDACCKKDVLTCRTRRDKIETYYRTSLGPQPHEGGI
jgi:hypothetical protein